MGAARHPAHAPYKYGYPHGEYVGIVPRVLDALLSFPVICSLIVSGCAAFLVSVVTRFIRDRDKLAVTMHKAESALDRIRRQIALKEGMIRQLQEEVALLRPVHDRLSAYYEQLSELQLEMERKDLKEETELRRTEREDDVFGRSKRPRL